MYSFGFIIYIHFVCICLFSYTSVFMSCCWTSALADHLYNLLAQDTGTPISSCSFAVSDTIIKEAGFRV